MNKNYTYIHVVMYLHARSILHKVAKHVKLTIAANSSILCVSAAVLSKWRCEALGYGVLAAKTLHIIQPYRLAVVTCSKVPVGESFKGCFISKEAANNLKRMKSTKVQNPRRISYSILAYSHCKLVTVSREARTQEGRVG